MGETRIQKCTCASEYQDERYGKGMRVHNVTAGKNKPEAVCTVCHESKRSKVAREHASASVEMLKLHGAVTSSRGRLSFEETLRFADAARGQTGSGRCSAEKK